MANLSKVEGLLRNRATYTGYLQVLAGTDRKLTTLRFTMICRTILMILTDLRGAFWSFSTNAFDGLLYP